MNNRRRDSRRRRQSFQRQRNQPWWNEWGDEELKEPEEPMKEELIPPMLSPQTKQVWKEKVTPSPSQEV
jgi:hypothetical protein